MEDLGWWISPYPLHWFHCVAGLSSHSSLAVLIVSQHIISALLFIGLINLNRMFVLTIQFCSDEKANEVEEFFASRTKPSIARTLKQSLERVRINARWVQSIRNEKSLGEVAKEFAHRKY